MADSPAAAGRPLRVLTANINAESHRYEDRLPLLHNAVAALDPDLMAFQEAGAYSREGPHQVARMLEGLGYHIHHQFDGLSEPPRRDGNCIASRGPVQLVETLSLQVTDRCAGYPLAAMAARIPIPPPAGELLFVNAKPSWELWAEHERELQAVAIADLDPSKWPIAAMTGTGALTLTPKETTALKNYLAAGGALVIDAAGGSREFAKAVEQHILPLVAGGSVGPIAPEHAIYRGPEKIGRVRFRTALAAILGRQSGKTRLQGVDRGGRLAIVFSRDDLTAGVLGAGCYGLRGYAPKTAVALMTNILCHVAGVGKGAPRK